MFRLVGLGRLPLWVRLLVFRLAIDRIALLLLRGGEHSVRGTFKESEKCGEDKEAMKDIVRAGARSCGKGSTMRYTGGVEEGPITLLATVDDDKGGGGCGVVASWSRSVIVEEATL